MTRYYVLASHFKMLAIWHFEQIFTSVLIAPKYSCQVLLHHFSEQIKPNKKNSKMTRLRLCASYYPATFRANTQIGICNLGFAHRCVLLLWTFVAPADGFITTIKLYSFAWFCVLCFVICLVFYNNGLPHSKCVPPYWRNRSHFLPSSVICYSSDRMPLKAIVKKTQKILAKNDCQLKIFAMFHQSLDNQRKCLSRDNAYA